MTRCIQCQREGLVYELEVCSELCGDRWADRQALQGKECLKKDLPSQILWGWPYEDGILVKFAKGQGAEWNLSAETAPTRIHAQSYSTGTHEIVDRGKLSW